LQNFKIQNSITTWSLLQKDSKTASYSVHEVFAKNPKQVFMNAFCTEVQSKVRKLVITLLQKSKAFFMRFLQGPKLFSFMKFLQNPKHFIHEVFAKTYKVSFFQCWS
jgi:hypothetical protein